MMNEMDMPNTEPYDVRMQILQMAKEMADRQFVFQKEIAMTYWKSSIKALKNSESSFVPVFPENTMPVPITSKSILETAERMCSFVSGSNDKSQ